MDFNDLMPSKPRLPPCSPCHRVSDVSQDRAAKWHFGIRTSTIRNYPPSFLEA